MNKNKKKKKIKDLTTRISNSDKEFKEKAHSLEKERGQKLNEIVERGRKNIKEHDIAFKLFKVQGETKAKELESRGADFDGEEAEEFKEKVIEERKAIIKKHEDIDKFIIVGYMEMLTKYNRELEKLDKAAREESEKLLKELNLIAGTNLQIVRGNLSYETKNWKKLMNQRKEKIMNNENCYGCISLRQFNKKEQEESMEAWRKAEENGALRCLADTNPHIAKCKIQGYLTGMDILRFDNCKDYKLGEKSKKQVFEEFRATGYYGEVLGEDLKGIKHCVVFSPEYSTKAMNIPIKVLEDMQEVGILKVGIQEAGILREIGLKPFKKVR